MADIIELILADHARIRGLLAEIETILAQADGTDWPAELPGRWEVLAALLEVHADAAEEIGFPALFGRVATLARDNAKATHDDIREAVRETRLHPAGSRPWRLAAAAAKDHIHELKSGALARFRRDAPMPAREALGRRWMTFVAASVDLGTHHDPSRREGSLSPRGP